MSEQSTAQNPDETASTAVNVTGSEPDVEVHQHNGTEGGDTADGSGEDKASDSAPSETTDGAKDGGSAE